MASLRNSRPLVVVLEAQVEPCLRRTADANALSLFQARSADQAVSEVRRYHPSVLVVQVSLLVGEALNETLRLIQLMTTATHPLPVIVVAASQDRDVELAVRLAGASYYVPGTEVKQVNRSLRAVLESRN